MARYGYICHSSELYHHGIKGQKWGKKNGPPYPLDPSDHSAKEKKLNNGRYSQGVKQDRGKKRTPMDEEKKRKIKKALAIGAGVAGAAALTAGGIYLAKHPGTAKAALNGVKDLTIAGAKGLKSSIKLSKIKNKSFRDNAQRNVNKSFAKQFDKVSSNIKSAKHKDWKNSMQRKVDRKRSKTGLLKDVSSDSALAKLMDSPHLLEPNKEKIIARNGGGTKGRQAYANIVKKAREHDINNAEAARYASEYRSNRGIKGVAKKVWAPVAGAAGVIGTVGGTIGRINSSVNTVANAARNPVYRKLYNDFMSDPYYEEQQRENRKKYNNNNRR